MKHLPSFCTIMVNVLIFSQGVCFMFRTLRAKLLAFFLLITFIPLIFIGYISYQSQKQELTNQIEQSLNVSSNYLAEETQNMLSERLNDIEYLAKNPIFKQENITREEIQNEFENFLNVYDIYSDVIFVKPDGVVYASMIDEVVGKDLNSREWFQLSMKGNTHISDIYLSPVLNKPVLVMSTPVYNANNEIIGVLSPSFDLNYLWETFDDFSNQKQISELNGYAFLMNVKGDIIVHPNSEKVLTNSYFVNQNLVPTDLNQISKSQKAYYNEDEETVVSFAHIERMECFDNNWFVGISVSKDALFEPLDKLLTNYLIIIALVLFIITVAVFKLATYIVTPVERLVAATTEFAVGKKVSPLLENSYEEVNRLNNTFTSMVKKLEERERGHKKSTLILETIDNGIIAINRCSSKITMFNKTSENLFAISKEEAIGHSVLDVINHSMTFKKFVVAMNLLEHLNKEEVKNRFELQCQINEKTYYFFISISSLPILDNEEEHEELLIVFNDLTEKRQMERELVRSEKLKVIGEMAAGLAHEIRNPLAIIRGFIQLFNQDEKDDSKKGYYNIIVKEIDRVNHFITDMLNIANPKSCNNCKETNLTHLIEDLLILQKGQFYNKGITIKKKFVEVPLIYIDPSKLQQVFINIIQNALEAMEHGGSLTIGIEQETEDNVKIYFQDTGRGMNQNSLEKIGTPFYTTKKTGTGLGLTISYRIIEEMDGKIIVHSEVGKGSVFTITLPISDTNYSFASNEINEGTSVEVV